MRVRVLAAVAAVCLFAGLAPAQYTFEPVPVDGPGFGFFGTVVGYKYPNGCVVGVDYTPPYRNVLVKPDGTKIPSPVPGTLTCVSGSGTFVGGLVAWDGSGSRGFRWNVGTGEVEYLDASASGWVYASPTAIADDGAAVVTGVRDGWLSAGTWRAGADRVVYVQCQPSTLPGLGGAYLQGAYYLEKGPGDTYVLYGRGWNWSSWWLSGTFRITGPLPE